MRENDWRTQIADFYAVMEPSLYRLGTHDTEGIKDTQRAIKLAADEQLRQRQMWEALEAASRQLVYGGSKVNNSTGQCQQYSQLESLLNEDAHLNWLSAAHERHNIPVPDSIAKRLAALKGEIAAAWRAELGRRIIEHERRIDELRSNEEKKRHAETELEKLKELRDGVK